MSGDLDTKIRIRFQRLEEGLSVCRDVIEAARGGREPSQVELAAVAYLLQTLYTDIEAVFKTIAQDLDGDVPDSDAWHRDLLEQMVQPATRRPAVISRAMADWLKEYLAFRHFTRNASLFILQWSEMGALALGCESMLAQFRHELEEFLQRMPG